MLLLRVRAVAEPPIVLFAGAHLLIDDHLIARQAHFARVINHPARLPGPVVTEDGVRWIRPHRVLESPGGLEIQFGASVFEQGADFFRSDEVLQVRLVRAGKRGAHREA